MFVCPKGQTKLFAIAGASVRGDYLTLPLAIKKKIAWTVSCQGFCFLALTVGRWQCFKDLLVNYKGAFRTAPAAPGLLKS